MIPPSLASASRSQFRQVLRYARHLHDPTVQEYVRNRARVMYRSTHGVVSTRKLTALLRRGRNIVRRLGRAAGGSSDETKWLIDHAYGVRGRMRYVLAQPRAAPRAARRPPRAIPAVTADNAVILRASYRPGTAKVSALRHQQRSAAKRAKRSVDADTSSAGAVAAERGGGSGGASESDLPIGLQIALQKRLAEYPRWRRRLYRHIIKVERIQNRVVVPEDSSVASRVVSGGDNGAGAGAKQTMTEKKRRESRRRGPSRKRVKTNGRN